MRTVLADGHHIVRSGVRALIESRPPWVVCAEAGSGEDLLKLTCGNAPDLVVMELGLPGLGGPAVIQLLRDAWPAAKILVFSSREDANSVSEALARGARGYVAKSDGLDHLMSGLTHVSANRRFLSPVVAEFALGAGASPRSAARPKGLTTREVEIVGLIADGLSTRLIGNCLGISSKTVESHRTAAMNKAGAANAAALVRFAIKHHLITE